MVFGRREDLCRFSGDRRILLDQLGHDPA
jgi:hypothetical protein